MEANLCDIHHLEAEVLLPPRKRLLAGLKKQNSDFNSYTSSLPSANSSGCEFDTHLDDLLKSHLSGPNRSIEEIVEASGLAALEAIKVAKAARATAEEKAAKAVKAVAAANSALELVPTVSDEASSRDKYLKKNKMKKHLPIQILYNKYQGTVNCSTDEEVARTLHREINSSPRISKNSTSDLRNHRHKRFKSSSPSEKAKFQNESTSGEGSQPSTSNGNETGAKDSNGLIQEKDLTRADNTKMEIGEASVSCKTNRLGMENGEGKIIISMEKFGETSDDICSIGKRNRLKQKQIPLSSCSFRDKANSKEDMKSKSSSSLDENIKATSSNKPVFPIAKTSLWKCQTFKVPACSEQNKVMQS